VDRYQRTGTHGEMINLDLHGAEEPIRWLLGWQRQDNVMMSPCVKKTEGCPHQDTLAEIYLGGVTPCRWDDGFDGQDATQDRLDIFWSRWQCARLVRHMWQVAGARGRPTFCLLDVDDAQKGPTSPSKGLDVSFFSSYFDILAFNVTNNEIMLSQPCRLFLMTYFVN
jgi:hypothetical protein